MKALQFVHIILLILAFADPCGLVKAAESKEFSHAKTQVKIKIGSSTFTATLEENATATAFKAMLPMTIKMKELNGNEKYYRLPGNLPTKPSNPGTIKTGDLMI